MIFPIVQAVVYRGTVSDIRISAVDDTAFVDNLPAAITDNYLGGTHLVEIYDSTGKAITGVLGVQGTEETLGSELLAGWDFTSGWSLGAGTTINDADTFTTTGSGGVAKSTLLTGGAVYKTGMVFTSTASTVAVGSINPNKTATSWVSILTGVTAYFSASYPDLYLTNRVAGTTDVVTVALQQVLTPSTSGCTIVSAKGGATERFKRIDTGFAFNSSSYTVIIKKLRG